MKNAKSKTRTGLADEKFEGTKTEVKPDTEK
jgi:hypothetical protein